VWSKRPTAVIGRAAWVHLKAVILHYATARLKPGIAKKQNVESADRPKAINVVAGMPINGCKKKPFTL